MSGGECVTADALLLDERGNCCVDPECKSTDLKDLTTVSSADENGVTRAGNIRITESMSFHIFRSVAESINTLRPEVEGLCSELW